MSNKEPQEIILPSSEADRERIQKVFQDISNIKRTITASKDTIKESIASLSEDFNLPKRFLNKLATAYHNDSFDKVAAEADDIEAARVVIFKKG